ncbi:hypothetical protein, partial [Klebsiella pneumoniae]|uniref:hypothetical protein n=1 Tax=Klebsiella pneumoniae TaxID=573 RepID=UPI0025A2CAD8
SRKGWSGGAVALQQVRKTPPSVGQQPPTSPWARQAGRARHDAHARAAAPSEGRETRIQNWAG